MSMTAVFWQNADIPWHANFTLSARQAHFFFAVLA